MGNRVNGVSAPVNVYEVTGLGPLRTRLQRSAGRGLTKFVGREREMEALKHAARQIKSGRAVRSWRRWRSEAAGVADRITFEVSNGANLPARIFYFVATFDVVHDAIDPHGLMAGIRRSLKDDSTYLVQEVNVSDKVGENLRPLGKMI